MESAVSSDREQPPAIVGAVSAHPSFTPALPFSIPLFNQLRDPIILLDREQRITYGNDAARSLLGTSAKDFIGSTFSRATDCEWPLARAAATSESAEPPVWRGWLARHARTGLQTRWDVSIITVHDDGSRTHYIVIVRHSPAMEELAIALAERMRFDKLLSELSAQFSGLLEDAVDDAIVSGLKRLVEFLQVDRSSFGEIKDSGLLVTHSFAAEGIAPSPKYVSDRLMPWLICEMRAGRTVVAPSIQGDLPEDAAIDKQSLALDGVIGGVAIPLHVGNSLICILTFGCIRRRREWPSELLDRLSVAGEIFANAVARRQAKERLDAKQRELAHLGRVVGLSELASVIAHELDQPLTAIMTNAQAAQHLLARPLPDLAESMAALDDVVSDTIRASQIVQRERRMLRRGQGTFEPLNLNEMVGEIELFIRGDARQQRCSCEIQLCPESLVVVGDRVQLQQVLLNVARNAIQVMSSQRREERIMQVRTRRDAGEILLEVQDAGPAVSNSHLEQMFNPFFTTRSGGLGMGLSISRSIVQAHHGRIWATRNPVAGLTFHIALPQTVEVQDVHR